MASSDLSEIVKLLKEHDVERNKLIPIDKLPLNIQECLLKKKEKEKDIFTINITSKNDTQNEDILPIYYHGKAINNDIMKQKLRIKLLQHERDRLQEINRKTNNNLQKNPKMIKILHEYNEIKDVAQQLMGTLNQMRGSLTKELYQEFGLELSD